MRWAGLLLVSVIAAQTGAAVDQAEILCLYDPMPEPVWFAVQELQEVLRNKGFTVTQRGLAPTSSAGAVFRVTVGDLGRSPTLPKHPLAAKPLVQPGTYGSFEFRVRKSGESAEVLVI